MPTTTLDLTRPRPPRPTQGDIVQLLDVIAILRTQLDAAAALAAHAVTHPEFAGFVLADLACSGVRWSNIGRTVTDLFD